MNEIIEQLRLIAENEPKVYNTGYEKGKVEADTTAYEQGVADGKQAEYDEFWDLIQPNQGAARRYQTAFGVLWHKNNFKPKYNLVPTNATQMFYNFGQDAGLSNSYGVLDLKEHLDNLGVELDFSKCTSCNACFSYATIHRVGEVRTDSLTNFQQMFANANYLITIDKIISHSNLVFNNTFQSSSKLENITFEGVIAQNGLNLQWANNLSHDSLVSIINCLADKSTDTSGTVWKVTVGSENCDKLTDEDWNNIQKKGWDFI